MVAVFGILGGSPAGFAGAPAHPQHTAVVSDASAASVSPDLTVLLMGDSYTAGNGARDDAGNPSYYGPERCMRSTGTWGEQYARLMEDDGYAVSVLNRACSAATTGAILHDRYMKDTRILTYPETESADAPRDDAWYTEWAATQPQCTPAPATEEYFVSSVHRDRGADGAVSVTVACERWLPAQAEALNPDVDLVLMTVGGNDVHFPDIARACLIMADAGACEDAINAARQYVKDDFSDDLGAVFETINHRTQGHAKVGYAAYPGLEVSTDLRITSVGRAGVTVFPVAQELATLMQEGLEAQRTAVDAANARFGTGFVTLMDAVPAMFRGHESDARPGSANPDRWMYEFLETTVRDEWYHLKPEGQRRIARYAATFGDFGASGDGHVTRDVALVVDHGQAASSAARAALADPSLWRGARVTLLEQRVAADGVHVQRRVIAESVAPSDALAAWDARRDSAWASAPDVQVQSRWNAVPQVVFVGDAALSLTQDATVWSGDDQGLRVSVDSRVVDATTGGHTIEALARTLREASVTPSAWAGGIYVASAGSVHLNARGSRGPGALSYAWDLDGDGVFEEQAPGAQMRVDASAVTSPWVAVRVSSATGRASVAWAWVAPSTSLSPESTPCISADGGIAPHSQSGRRGCWPQIVAPAGPDTEPLPLSRSPEARMSGSSDAGSSGGGAMSDEGRLLAALALQPMYADERLVGVSGGRVTRPSRAGDQGRGRPRELVRREKSLRLLLAERLTSR